MLFLLLHMHINICTLSYRWSNCFFVIQASFELFHAEKIHCVWLKDGVIKVLYECSKFPGPDHLGVTTRDFIKNQNLVDEYLESNNYIPHFTTNIDMEAIKLMK